MVAPTRREWEARMIAAWSDEPCPHCGWHHPAVALDDEGNVYIYCPRADREYWIAWERVPTKFAPEPDYPDDLPF
jgi:hypothetical protein